MKVIIDADAFLVLRHLGLLHALLAAPHVHAVMLERAARYELSDIQREVCELEAALLIRVEAVKARTPEFERFRNLVKRRVDKGEAEAIAWAGSLDDAVLFISQDKRARAEAATSGLEAVDVADLLSLACHEGLIDEDRVRAACSRWDDHRNEFGRPRDWSGFDRTMATRIVCLRDRGVSIRGPDTG